MKRITVDLGTPACLLVGMYELASGVRDSILQTVEYVFFNRGNAYCVNLNVSSPHVGIVYQSELGVPPEMNWP
jgi:hypothetical protein